MSGALRQQTSLNLVLLALERYLAQVNFDLHLAVFSKHLTIIYIFLTWISSIGLYFIIVFVLDGFYLSTSAFSVCEPHYRSVQMLILTSCVFYFPTTMVLMYCYGTIYHSQKLKMKNRSILLLTRSRPILISLIKVDGQMDLLWIIYFQESIMFCSSYVTWIFGCQQTHQTQS